MTEIIELPRWQSYIEAEIGLVMPKRQNRWVYNAILELAKSNHLSIDELWQAVQTDRLLRQQLFDSVLIIESRFFRHLPSLNYVAALAKDYAQTSSKPSHLAQSSLHLPFRVWSVGCASGQEVWSLAMMLEDSKIDNYVILGSDVSLTAIKCAKKAHYSGRELSLIPAQYHKYIQNIDTDEAKVDSFKHWKIADELYAKVNFAQNNAMTRSVPTPFKQQVIMCQNMLIYFRRFDQRDILAKLVDQCVLGGYLILAPGEALFWQHPKMQRLTHDSVNVWQKIAE